MKERGKQLPRRGLPMLAGQRWWWWIGVSTGVGLAIRIAAVVGRPNREAVGDAYYYHSAANLLVDGKGFINPFVYFLHGHASVPTAAFPPGFVWVLAAASLVGFKTFFAHRIWCCIVGSAAVALSGLVGRRVGGQRVGLITAFLVAVYPNFWMTNDLAMSETLSPLLVAVVLLAAYRFWERPGWRRAVWLGASIGLATLVRDELALLAVFILAPLVLLTPEKAWSEKLTMMAVAIMAALMVVGPWVGYNMSRFKDPTFVSTGLGVTLASANCPATYGGPFEGYWDLACSLKAPVNPHADESVQGAEAESYALQYVRSHDGRFVVVEGLRLGRGFGFFRPIQQIELDSFVEGRPLRWAEVGLVVYYGLLALSIGGSLVLRKRGVPVFPLWAVGLTVLVSMLLTFGQTRYRSTFEVSFVLLSAVQLAWIWDRLTTKRLAGTDGTEPAADNPHWALPGVGVSLPSR
jgi:4-amino-4-deoxy-L-arabinose transferase-like glycosyltransferase